MLPEIEAMSRIEEGFRKLSGLPDRRYYKIFYSGLFEAEFLLLGLQPRGKPEDFSADGSQDFTRGMPAAASAAYYEGGEHDLLDCDWPFAAGARKLFQSGLFSEFSAAREKMVACNLAFVRRDTVRTGELRQDLALSRVGLAEILHIVRPRAIITTFDFTKYPVPSIDEVRMVGKELEPGVKQLVLATGTGRLGRSAIRLYGCAHPSQFSWIYGRYKVGSRIRADLNRSTI